MQTTRKQILAAALAVVLIAAGALFLIAPVWPPIFRSRRHKPLRRSRSLSTSIRPRQRN